MRGVAAGPAPVTGQTLAVYVVVCAEEILNFKFITVSPMYRETIRGTEREKARIPGVSVFVLCTLHASTGQTIRSLSSKCVF